MKSAFALAITLAASAPAWAGVVEGQSTNLFNAGATCLPALQRFDGDVRKRPLAVVNEGADATFVTCNYTVDEEAYDSKGGVERFDITAKNQGSAAAQATCTAVVGIDDGQARYIAKSVTLQPGARAKLEWKAEDYGLQAGWEGPVSMSCLLLPQMALNEGHVHWAYRDETGG